MERMRRSELLKKIASDKFVTNAIMDFINKSNISLEEKTSIIGLNTEFDLETVEILYSLALDLEDFMMKMVLKEINIKPIGDNVFVKTFVKFLKDIKNGKSMDTSTLLDLDIKESVEMFYDILVIPSYGDDVVFEKIIELSGITLDDLNAYNSFKKDYLLISKILGNKCNILREHLGKNNEEVLRERREYADAFHTLLNNNKIDLSNETFSSSLTKDIFRRAMKEFGL